MSGKVLKERAKSLAVSPKSGYAFLQKLILDGFVDRPVSSEDVVRGIKEKFGERWQTSRVQTYMKRFMTAGIIHAVKPDKLNQNFWVLASVSRDQALKLIGKTKKIQQIEEEIFSDRLTKKLSKDFSRELGELRDNLATNGNCTAFLLRKILEKLIILTFSKNGREKALEDKTKPGGWRGLENMIDIAAQEKLAGVPFLIPRTAREIRGIKFLGDTAAHNPLANVDMNTIVPQMPYVITAYDELAKRL